MVPTVVLVHGAFAESASWDGVIDPLRSAGHPVIAAANPLRGLAADARSVERSRRQHRGPRRAGRALLRWRGDLQRRCRLRRDHRAGLCQWFRARCRARAALRWRASSRAARSVRRPAAGLAQRRHHRSVHRRRSLPRAVLCRCAGAAGDAAGRDPATGDPGGARRALGRAAVVERGAVVVPASARTIASSRRPCSTTWPIAPARAATVEIPGASHGAPVSQPHAVAELILQPRACPRRPGPASPQPRPRSRILREGSRPDRASSVEDSACRRALPRRHAPASAPRRSEPAAGIYAVTTQRWRD